MNKKRLLAICLIIGAALGLREALRRLNKANERREIEVLCGDY
jgi:hypothetical protein